MLGQNKTQNSNFPNRALGLALVIAGGVWFVGQFLQVNFGESLWPFFIIIPGGILLTASHSTDFGKEKLSIAGCVICAVGLLLLYQNTFNHFESWAYAWALVLPCAGGLGLLFNGTKQGIDSQIKLGRRFITAGAALFVSGAIFFELIINISGRGISGLGVNSYLWPALFIGTGVIVLGRRK